MHVGCPLFSCFVLEPERRGNVFVNVGGMQYCTVFCLLGKRESKWTCNVLQKKYVAHNCFLMTVTVLVPHCGADRHWTDLKPNSCFISQ